MLPRAIATLLLLLAGAAPAAAQSLADAAKRAEDNSATSKVYAPTFSNSTLTRTEVVATNEAMTLELTMPLVRQYAKTKHIVLDALLADAALDERFEALAAWSHSAGDMERAYIREPKLMDVLKTNGFAGPRDYFAVQLALDLATAAKDQRMEKVLKLEHRGKISANMALLTANKQECDAIAKQLDDHEEKVVARRGAISTPGSPAPSAKPARP